MQKTMVSYSTSFILLLSLLSLSSIIPSSYSHGEFSDSISDFISTSSSQAKSFFSNIISSIEGNNKEEASHLQKIVIPLKRIKKSLVLDVIDKLGHIAEVSLARAHVLKSPKELKSENRTGVFSKSYGEYSISLHFGSPPQSIPLIVDTGSDLVWFPCTEKYVCMLCNSTPVANPMATPKMEFFDPQKSSSSQNPACDNPICQSIHSDESTCKNCKPGSGSKCTEPCPDYEVLYGSGFTNGTLISETLNFGNTKIPNFVVGCSEFTMNIPVGIAGFGRDAASLPTQIGLRKFSHCFLSKMFNETSKSSPLILYSGSDSGDNDDDDEKIDGISYTPFIKNPEFSNFYYVELNKITVGGKDVEIPDEYLLMNSKGNGGAIMDSGTSFTFMEQRIFNKVASEIDKQVGDYKRLEDVEKNVRLFLCYQIPNEVNESSFPKLGFHFKGGASMDLPVVNTFWFLVQEQTRVACLAIVSGDGKGPIVGGPSVILGNFQQQNFHVEYDLKNERLGFRQKDCSE